MVDDRQEAEMKIAMLAGLIRGFAKRIAEKKEGYVSNQEVIEGYIFLSDTLRVFMQLAEQAKAVEQAELN